MKKLGDRCTLRITEAFPEDEGVYKCIVNNPAGDVTTTASLTVLGKYKRSMKYIHCLYLVLRNLILLQHQKVQTFRLR